MDSEKNQRPPTAALLRRERRKRFRVQALSCTAVAFLLLLLIHHFGHDISIAGFNSLSLPRTEGRKYGHHHPTMKEREKLFLYVRRLLVIISLCELI